MRLLYLGNNWLGLKVLEHLRDRGEDDVAGLVIHPADQRKYVEEMLDVANLSDDCVFDGATLGDADVRAQVRDLGCAIGVSVLFDYLLDPTFLGLFPDGVINLHPSYLPYNRGQYPNVWSIIEGTPAGVTLHYVDAGIDTGDIIARHEVAVDAVDTGETLYRKLERAAVTLFRENWPAIRAGRIERTAQNDEGASHRTRDVETIDRIDLDRTYTGRELINLLRARTFPPHRGAYIEVDGQRVYLELSLSCDTKVGHG